MIGDWILIPCERIKFIDLSEVEHSVLDSSMQVLYKSMPDINEHRTRL